MQDVLKNPPASVQETCDLFLQQKGVNKDDAAASVLTQAVAFGCAATASRQMSQVGTDATASNAVNRVLHESRLVVIEATLVSNAINDQTSH